MGDPPKPALEILPELHVLELWTVVRRHLEFASVPFHTRQAARLRSKIRDRVHVLSEPEPVQRRLIRGQVSTAEHADGLSLPIRAEHGATEQQSGTRLRRKRRNPARTTVYAHILAAFDKVDVIPLADPDSGIRSGWRYIATQLRHAKHRRFWRNRRSISDDKRDMRVILNFKTKI